MTFDITLPAGFFLSQWNLSIKITWQYRG